MNVELLASVPYRDLTGWISPVSITLCESQFPLLFGIFDGNFCELAHPGLNANQRTLMTQQADATLPDLSVALFFERFQLFVRGLPCLYVDLRFLLTRPRRASVPTPTPILGCLTYSSCASSWTAFLRATSSE